MTRSRVETASASQRVDSHVHLWRYVPAEHPWMTPEMGVLQRDYLPPELHLQMARAGLGKAIAVQARSSLDETEWLLGLAEQHPFLAGVVGWVPLWSPRVEHDLARLARNPKLAGIRHVLTDDPDPERMLRDDYNRGVRLLGPCGLVHDIVILEQQLPQAVLLVDRHPDQVFVLDHLGRPRIREGLSASFRTHIRRLAERPNVYCKLSGMTTGADWQSWTIADLEPYAHLALEAFGAQRLMFGSDWPMCLLSCDYARWVDTVQALTAGLSDEEKDWLWGKTAERAYRLSSRSWPVPSP